MPVLKKCPFCRCGADKGHTSLVSLSGEYGVYTVLAFGILCIIISIKIPLIELEDEEENKMLEGH